MSTEPLITRRAFSTLLGATAGAAMTPALLLGDRAVASGADAGSFAPSPGRSNDGDVLQSAFLMELGLERGAASSVGPPGATRVVVAVAGGTFQGPRLRGTLVAPSGDWIVGRGRALARVARGERGDALSATLQALRDEGTRAEMFALVPPLDAAIAQVASASPS